MIYPGRRYKKLKVWQKAMQKAADIYNDILYCFPGAVKLGLKPQVFDFIMPTYTSRDVFSNETRLKHDLEVALVSTFEFEAQLLLAKRLGVADSKKLELLTKLVSEGQQGLCSFVKKLNA